MGIVVVEGGKELVLDGSCWNCCRRFVLFSIDFIDCLCSRGVDWFG